MWAWFLVKMGVVPYLVRVPGRHVHQHGAGRGVLADGDVGVVLGEDGRVVVDVTHPHRHPRLHHTPAAHARGEPAGPLGERWLYSYQSGDS